VFSIYEPVGRPSVIRSNSGGPSERGDHHAGVPAPDAGAAQRLIRNTDGGGPGGAGSGDLAPPHAQLVAAGETQLGRDEALDDQTQAAPVYGTTMNIVVDRSVSSFALAPGVTTHAVPDAQPTELERVRSDEEGGYERFRCTRQHSDV